MKIRQEYNLPKLKPANEREYGSLPDTPPGKYAQVDFGEYKLRKGDGSRIKVYFFAMILEYSRYKFIWFQNNRGSTYEKDGFAQQALEEV